MPRVPMMCRHPGERPWFCQGEGLLRGWGWCQLQRRRRRLRVSAGLLRVYPAGVKGLASWVSHVAPSGFCSSGTARARWKVPAFGKGA